MISREVYPKVVDARYLPDYRVLVTFGNDVQKIYDCSPLLSDEPFASLKDMVLFRSVRPDTHGYGIVWNDAIDLAESELWINGKVLSESALSTNE